MRESEGEVQRLLTEIVISSRLRRREGTGKEIPITKDGDTTVELTRGGGIDEVDIEAGTIRGKIGDRGGYELCRELLQIPESIGILIAEIEAVEQCLALVQRASEVHVGTAGIEAPSGERYRATSYVQRLLGHSVDDATWGSVPKESRGRPLDHLHTLDIG